jgi:integrase
LVDLEVHSRVIMRILRHADVSMTMTIYANASSTATSEALRRLGSPSDEHRAYGGESRGSLSV